LPATADFKEKSFDVPAPEKLKPGYYFIAASHDAGFREGNNIVSMTDVWISDLAMVTRTRGGSIEGFITEANSGEPVTGAAVSVWHLDNNGNRVADPDLTTDTNGFFAMKPAQNRGYLFLAGGSGAGQLRNAERRGGDGGVPRHEREGNRAAKPEGE
jgi:uncharacterized protein YfaS (alpha-2-macroglobulin family)